MAVSGAHPSQGPSQLTSQLALQVDCRLGGTPRYYLSEQPEVLMLVPPQVQECVAFVCYNSVKHAAVRFGGTAFAVAVPVGDGARQFCYWVTARHVLDEIRADSSDGKAYLRVNVKERGATLVESSLHQWHIHPSDASVDVAVLNWAPDPNQVEFMPLAVDMLLTDETIASEKVGPGDEVFITGLFGSHYGQKRNLPIIRIGNIAMMPPEKVYTGRFGLIDAYLIEARSIGGISGSPVFAHLAGLRGNVLGAGKFYLLGLIHGHWDLPLTESDALVTDAGGQSVNMGIAIAVPAKRILEVINHPVFVAKREAAEKEIRAKNTPVED